VAAAKGGLTRSAIESDMPRLHTVPFDSDRKRMTVVRVRGEDVTAFVKGAPEVILERCTHILTEQGPVELSARRPDPDGPGRCADGERCLAGAGSGQAVARVSHSVPDGCH
jgi:magnesium-transporting ATPase (P-type)